MDYERGNIMFWLYFGNYLMEKNKISRSQFEDVMLQQQKTRAKLGLIAVSEKLLTTKQAEEINDIQHRMDRRFGDVAIEKGYLLAEEVTYLLNMQGNPYLQFVQTCADHHILSLQEIEAYLEEFRHDNHFSETDLDALKSGDIDRIIPVFTDTSIPFTGECISLIIRNLVRFISSDLILKKAYSVSEYSFGAMASQKIVGDHEIFVGLAGKAKELLKIANPYAKENFIELDDDAFDAVCEFINCTNGLYATRLSHEDIHIDMTPPLFYTDKKITSEGNLYVVPIIINGEQTDLVVATDNQVVID